MAMMNWVLSWTAGASRIYSQRQWCWAECIHAKPVLSSRATSGHDELGSVL